GAVGYLANGSEPSRLPDVSELPKLEPGFAEPGQEDVQPFARHPATPPRPRAIPGTAGPGHRIGGLGQAACSANHAHPPATPDKMTRLRQAKVDGIANDVEPLAVDDPSGKARVLVIGWGGTFGSISAAVRLVRAEGRNVAQAH